MKSHRLTPSQIESFVQKWVEKSPISEIDSSAHPGERISAVELLNHGREVFATLESWGAKSDLLVAGLVHSLLWNCAVSTDEVLKHCGKRVLFLCQEYQRILERMPESKWRGRTTVLDEIKYFILAYRDHDLALLGAADLWCHVQSSRHGNSAHQRRYADIATQVLSPYLDLLGMNHLREELEESLLSINKRQSRQLLNSFYQDSLLAFNQIAEQISTTIPWAQPLYRNRFFATSPLSDGEAVSPSTVHFKSHPVLHIDLLVEDELSCYQTLYWLHKLYTPVEGMVNDHIGNCRRNGYRCLQTVVIGEIEDHEQPTKEPIPANGQDYSTGAVSQKNDSVDGSHQSHIRTRIHFEICTHEMNEINRWGLAAVHLRQHSLELQNVWWNSARDKFSLIESAPLGSLPESLYVFSPNGELFHFHRGCTVIDYAYNVHSELAAQCRRFFVNGETVEPATVLHHLDLVELEHDPTAPGPTSIWLSAARTPRARTHIDRYLKRQGKGIYHAQKTLDKRLKALENHYGFNMPEHRVNQALSQEMKRRNIPTTDELMAEISSGRLAVDRLLHPFFADEIIRQVRIPPEIRLRPHQLELAQCCRPKPGDDIIGRPYVRDNIVTKLKIHRLHCKKLGSHANDALQLKWRLQPELKAVAQLEMQAMDEDGLLGDAVGQIYAMLPSVTLYKAEAQARNGVAIVRFVIEAASGEIIEEIADALRRLPNRTVDEVRHISLPLSEREELVKPVTTTQMNPYSRMPVYEEGMFFGRSKELSEIRDWLRARVGIIWLLGQKRVGKTSLLLHLKNHFLDSKEFTPIYFDFQMLSSLRDSDIFFELANATYEELQADGHSLELGPPLHTMFEHDPMAHLVRYLRRAQNHIGSGKLVLLLDEFSRTTDAHLQGKVDESFFKRWRGLVQMTQPDVKFVIVVQQQAFDSMVERVQGGVEDPTWRLMELGEKMPLLPLTDRDARHLIEWPIRNYLEFAPELLEHIYRLTGGSPFLIQSFCFKLVSHMIQLNKRQVEREDIERVSMEFMSPNESVFAHLLDLIRGVANSVCSRLAKMADEEMQQNKHSIPLFRWEQVREANSNIHEDRLRSTLNELCERHILVQQEAESWHFSSILFQEWLALNTVG